MPVVLGTDNSPDGPGVGQGLRRDDQVGPFEHVQLLGGPRQPNGWVCGGEREEREIVVSDRWAAGNTRERESQ